MLSTTKYSSNSNLFWFEITFVKFHKLHLCFPLQLSSCCLFRWALLPAHCQAVSGKVRLSVDSCESLGTSRDSETACTCLKLGERNSFWGLGLAVKRHMSMPWSTWNTSYRAGKCHTRCHLGGPDGAFVLTHTIEDFLEWQWPFWPPESPCLHLGNLSSCTQQVRGVIPPTKY